MTTKHRIGEMLSRLKMPVEIQDSDIYKRLTIRINHQGVSLRDTEIGANIGTKKQFRVCAGDFILSKIDARQGAFGIVPPEVDGGVITGNFWTYRVDNQIVDTDWFLQFTSTDDFLDLCKRSSTGNTHRKYLNEEIFLDHEVAIPSIEEQRRAVASGISGSVRVEKIRREITHQQSLLSKLKRAILEEAIQGKLTSGWRAANPNVTPVSQLLDRIKVDKARLIAEKKHRKEKPLALVTAEETPFNLPNGWEWCRYGSLCEYVTSGSRGWKKYYSDSGALFIRAQNVKTDELVLDDKAFVTLPKTAEGTRSRVARNDILVTITGGNVAKTAIVEEDFEKAYVSQHIALTRLVNTDLAKWVHQTLITDAGPRGQLLSSCRGDKPGLNLPNVRHVLIPLPPVEEQLVIMERVERLLANCGSLENEIERSKANVNHLLDAVHKEAFALPV